MLHTQWGGVVPSIAKRAHQEHIDMVIQQALKKSKMTMSDIDYIAVTYGPGLAIALEVGISKAKELAEKYHKPLYPINHMEGHIYSCFVQNSSGNPKRDFVFPCMVLLVSGGHTELVYWEGYHRYTILGETRDDAAGEAFDKAARMLGFGYPGGPIIERLAHEVGNSDTFKFPRPMIKSQDFDFSFSGLKTAFLYFLRQYPEEEKAKQIKHLASSFQEAVVDTLLIKTDKAMKEYGSKQLVIAGGVAANQRLRSRMRILAKKYTCSVLFPTYKYLNGDNAAMIGVAAYYRIIHRISPPAQLDRMPRLSLA